MVRLATLLLFLVVSVSDSRLQQLAADGQIQQDAPVKASSEIVIDAPPERVWAILTDVNDWPKWQRDISRADMRGPLQPGAEFTWTSGMQINSRIALLRPPQAFGWTGKAHNARAIHVWKLEPLPNNQTRVSTNESMEGFMLSAFYSSKKLKESQEHWLASLKTAAERK